MANNKISPAVEEAFRHVVLLSALKDAPAALHQAVMNGADEKTLHGHLLDYVKQLHSTISDSASGKGKGADDDGAGKSRAQKLRQFVENTKDAAEPPVVTPQSHVSVAGQPPAANESRQKKVGRLFKS